MLQTLRGHASDVTLIAFSSDGALLLSASLDKTIKVWNLATGSCLHTIECPTAITSMAITADGCHVVVGFMDRVIRVWPARTTSSKGMGRYTAPTPLPITTAILGVLDDGEPLGIVNDASLELSVMGVLEYVYSDECLPMDNLVAETRPSYRLPVVLKGHAGPIASVAVSADSRQAVSGSWDATVRLWSLVTFKELRVFHGHTKPIHSVRFNESGEIFSASEDNMLRVWNAFDGALVRLADARELNRPSPPGVAVHGTVSATADAADIAMSAGTVVYQLLHHGYRVGTQKLRHY